MYDEVTTVLVLVLYIGSSIHAMHVVCVCGSSLLPDGGLFKGFKSHSDTART